MRPYQIQRTYRLPSQAVALCRLLFIVLSLASVARAQDKEEPKRGLYPGGSYAVSDIETINTTHGNLLLSVPVGALPPGRGGMAAKLTLNYDSKLFDINYDYIGCPKVPVGPGLWPKTPQRPECTGDSVAKSFILTANEEGLSAGWHYNYKYTPRFLYSVYTDYRSNTGICGSTQVTVNVQVQKLQVTYPDGSVHDFRLQGYAEPDTNQPNFFPMFLNGNVSSNSDCKGWAPTTNDLTYYSVDGSYSRLVVGHAQADGQYPWTLYLSDGARVTGYAAADPGFESSVRPQRIYDRNANYIEISDETYNGHHAVKIADQVGRKLILEHSTANEDIVRVWSLGERELTWTVKWKTLSFAKQYNAGHAGVSLLDFERPMVDQVILPRADGQTQDLAYTFGYNEDAGVSAQGWGEVNYVRLPSGARARYAYKRDGQFGSTIFAKDVLENSVTGKELRYDREYDGLTSEAVETWTYSINSQGGVSTVTGPDGGVTTQYFYGTSTSAWNTGLVYKTVGADGTVVEKEWRHNTPFGYPSYASGKGDNTYVAKEYSSITNGAGALVKTAIKDYSYDKNGNVTSVKQYDWADYSNVHDGSGTPLWSATRPSLLSQTANVYYASTPDASDSATDDPEAYHKPTAPLLCSTLISIAVCDSAAVCDAQHAASYSEFHYDDPLTKGNLTLNRSWDSTKAQTLSSQQPDGSWLDATNSISMSAEYDSFGNPTLSTDANGIQTKLTYGAVGGFTGLYPTRTETAYGTSVQRTSTSEHDFWTGLLTKATDEDNHVSNVTTYDLFGRPILVEEADGATDAATGLSIERQTSTEYSDLLRRVVVRSDLSATGDQKIVSVQHYDELGRVRLTRSLEDSSTQDATDETVGIKVQSRYLTDPSAHYSYRLISNPYRAATSSSAAGESTMGWTVTTSDEVGRGVRSETFGGAALPAPFAASNPNTNTSGAVTTSFDAEATTVTDQAGKQRRTVTDGLGRLSQVYEAPGATAYNYLTGYTYSATGNLTQVAQGAQTRTFAYSSLSRLIAATGPEACQQQQTQCVPVPVTFEYDRNGNLKKKVDARGVIVLYNYDELNRVKARSYSGETGGATPNVTYTYDDPSVQNSRGRLTSVSSSASTYNFGAYDALGRVRSSAQTVDGVTYSMPDYRYDVAGNLTSEQYPSGRVVKTEFDSAGRVAGVRNQATGFYYAGAGAADSNNRIHYAAHGAASSLKLGNGLWEHTLFSARLQPTEIGLGSTSVNSTVLQLTYSYGTTDNNGNVRGQTITVPGAPWAYTQVYAYDELNRLQSAEETTGSSLNWKQVYFYDRYGNRTLASGTTYPNSLGDANNPAVSAADNRITSPGYAYDTAGNLLCDPAHPCAQTPSFTTYFAYDAENHLKTAGGALTSGGATYAYDGDGRRVKKVAGSAATVFVYDAAGRLVAEYGGAQGAGGVSYLTRDTLGSTRVVTGQNQEVRGRYDYMPFGEECYAGRSGYGGEVRQKFTGKERDEETGMDYMQARYFSSTQGRFISPDPVAGSCWNPQSLNAYSYVWNNPLKLTDATGMIVSWEDSEKKKKKGETEARTDAQRKYENRIKEMVNSKDSKIREQGEKLQATYERLQKSDVTFHVVENNPGGASSGELTYAGQEGHLYVNLKGNSAGYGALTDTQKLAHEFEHGRQFLDSQLGFAQGADGQWHGYRDDLVDEAEAFIAGFEAQPLDPAQKGDKFLSAVELARPYGVDAVVAALDRQGPYAGRSKTQNPITNVTPTIYAVPRNKK
jgi:RHS repeat-associated protein